MVHRTHKRPRSSLSFLAPAVVLRSDAVAGLRLRRASALLLEEFLLLPVATRTLLGRPTLLRLLRSLHRRLSLLRRTLLLRLGLSAWLVRLVFATTPAAPMSLRLTLAIGRGRPQLVLGHRRFCCHACTSWHFAVSCINSLASALPFTGLLSFPLSAASRLKERFRRVRMSRLSMQSRNVSKEQCSRTQSTTTFAYPRRVNSGCTFPARSHRGILVCSLDNCLSPGSLRRMTATPSMRLQGQTSNQNAQAFCPTHLQQHSPVVWIGTIRPAFPGVMPVL